MILELFTITFAYFISGCNTKHQTASYFLDEEPKRGK